MYGMGNAIQGDYVSVNGRSIVIKASMNHAERSPRKRRASARSLG